MVSVASDLSLSFYAWSMPNQTVHSLCFIGTLLLIALTADMAFCMKLASLLGGISFFVSWPIASLYPKYRYLVSPVKWVFWGIPTDGKAVNLSHLRRIFFAVVDVVQPSRLSNTCGIKRKKLVKASSSEVTTKAWPIEPKTLVVTHISMRYYVRIHVALASEKKSLPARSLPTTLAKTDGKLWTPAATTWTKRSSLSAPNGNTTSADW